MWHSSVSWISGHHFISSLAEELEKWKLFSCLRQTHRAHSLFSAPVLIMHAWRLLNVLWSSCRCVILRLINHSVRVSAKMHSRAGTSAVAICVCVPHAPPVQWFTVSLLGHMTENRWHSGSPPHPQHTHTHTPPHTPWEHRAPAMCSNTKQAWLYTTHTHSVFFVYSDPQNGLNTPSFNKWLSTMVAS